MGRRKYDMEFVREYCQKKDIEFLDDEYMKLYKLIYFYIFYVTMSGKLIFV